MTKPGVCPPPCPPPSLQVGPLESSGKSHQPRTRNSVSWLCRAFSMQCRTRGRVCTVSSDTRATRLLSLWLGTGTPVEQTQAGVSYIVNKTAAQNSPEHSQPGKQGNRTDCGTFPPAAPTSPHSHGTGSTLRSHGQHPASGRPSWRPHRGVFVRSGPRERC